MMAIEKWRCERGIHHVVSDMDGHNCIGCGKSFTDEEMEHFGEDKETIPKHVDGDPECFGLYPFEQGLCVGYLCPAITDCELFKNAGSAVLIYEEQS